LRHVFSQSEAKGKRIILGVSQSLRQLFENALPLAYDWFTGFSAFCLFVFS